MFKYKCRKPHRQKIQSGRKFKSWTLERIQEEINYLKNFKSELKGERFDGIPSDKNQRRKNAHYYF